MNLAGFAFRQKALIHFLLFIMTVGGVFALLNMSKLEDPELKVKKAMIITLYPGASSHEVELQVTDVIEKQIRSMGSISEISSRSMANYSEITVDLEKTIRGDEIEQKWDLLRRKVLDAQSKLPADAKPSIIRDDFGDVYGMFYAMTSDGYPYETLKNYAEMVKRELLTLDDVRRVEIYGVQEPCINIELSEQKMANLGIHPSLVLLTLSNQNKTVYPGNYEHGDQRIRFAINDVYTSIEDIKNVLIQGFEKDQIRLRDIATVYKDYKKPFRTALRYNKQTAIGISISMESGGNIIALGKNVDKTLATLKQQLPIGIDFNKVFFQPEKVDSAIQQFIVNLLESIAIVIVIIMLTMGFQSGIIIGASLLFTILGTLTILYLMGGTLQRVSLASFIVAMGMLVDNAIVIVDGILIDLQKGHNRKFALRSTPKKTAIPLLGATLIAIFAFLPIFLSPDTTGEYTKDLFIVLAVSLLLSWVLALTQAPLFADRKFKKVKKETKDLHSGKLYKFIEKTVKWGIKNRYLTVFVALIFVAISGYAFGFIRQGFFPDFNYNQVYIEFKMPEGTRVEKVTQELEEIEAFLLEQPYITAVTMSTGQTPSRYNLVRSIADPSTSYGELIVDFVDADKMKEKIPNLQNDLTAQYPHAFIRIKRYNLMYKKFPIEVLFRGSDPEVLRNLAKQVQNIMEESPAITLIANDWEPETPILVADYSQEKARHVGLTRSDVSLSLLAATDGIPVGSYYDGNQEYPLIVKTTDIHGEKIEDYKNVPVWASSPLQLPKKEQLESAIIKKEIDLSALQKSVPMQQVVEQIKHDWQPPVVRRSNGQRAIKAQGNPTATYSVEDARQTIAKEIEAIELPTGYTMEWQGEFEASTDSKKNLFKNLPLAIVLMITVLIALFRDYKKPIIILLSLPLAAIGIVFGMLLFGKEFGFTAIVGALGLIGMMIKNGVVLLEEIAHQLYEGKSAYNAVVDSALARTRPVIMASLTTILGMIPLVADDLFGGMAVTIMAGLLVGTMTTLVFIPVLYTVIFRVENPK